MRVAVLALIVVNVLLFLYARLDHAAQSEPGRLDNQVQPESIKLLSPREVAALRPAVAAVPPGVCVEWGPFAEADRLRAQGDLEPLALGRLVSQRPVTSDTAYWDNTGAMPNRAAADRRAADLRTQSITDLSVVDYGHGQFTVSLGVFRTQAAGNARAESLAALGITGVRVEPRSQTVTQTMFVVRDPPEPALARIKALQAQYAGSELKVGSCVPAS
jgi:hypothetical protein